MNQRIQKQNIREKYWRYSLYVILLGLGTVIFVELIPFLGGLLGALTIYVLLRGQMRALTIRHKLRRSLAASLLIGEAIVCFLIPLSLLVWLLVAKLQDVTLDPSTVIQPIRNLAELIRERIGYNLLDGDNIAKLVELLPRAGQWVLQSIGSFAVNVVVVITQVDNLARFVLQKRMADTHPLVTIFGVIIGLSLFGFMGVIFGPVLLSIFIFCADLFKRRYLDEAPMNEVLASPAERSSESGRE